MRLIIVRHGETIENSQGIIQGHLQGRLSEIGKKQAEKLAKRLKDENIGIIYSSDLARAVDTTKEIAKYHSAADIFYVKDIREKFLGKAQGKNSSDFKNHSFLELECGESTKSLMKRIADFLSNVMSNNPKKSILIVGHGGSVIALIANILNKSFDDALKMGNIGNTSVTIFDPFPNLKLFNCVKHLIKN